MRPCGFWKTGQRRGRVHIRILRLCAARHPIGRSQETMHLNIHYTRRTVPCHCALTQPRAAGARDMRIFLRPYVGPRPMCRRRPCECSRCAHAIGLRGGETVRQCRAFGQTRQARAVSDHFSECLLSSLCSALPLQTWVPAAPGHRRCIAASVVNLSPSHHPAIVQNGHVLGYRRCICGR